ncbi:Os04g0539200 [Oryza sativa Japonica Group]|nr:Os04g0539200 [Oryza sativa Japonica Group]
MSSKSAWESGRKTSPAATAALGVAIEPRRWRPECRCKVRSEEADPVGGGCPRGGRCLGVRVEEIFLNGSCRGLRRRPLGRRRAGSPGGGGGSRRRWRP